MASRIYTTEGFVLSRVGVGESSLLVSLFSRDLGRMQARAQGARAHGSKLRFGLEPLSRGRFSLVKGRAGWKLVGVEPSVAFQGRGKNIRVLGSIMALLQRLAPPHEPVPGLYDLLLEDLFFIGKTEDEDILRSAECIAVLHVLSALGYLPETPDVTPFAERSACLSLTEEMKPLRTRAVALINTSLSASGL